MVPIRTIPKSEAWRIPQVTPQNSFSSPSPIHSILKPDVTQLDESHRSESSRSSSTSRYHDPDRKGSVCISAKMYFRLELGDYISRCLRDMSFRKIDIMSGNSFGF